VIRSFSSWASIAYFGFSIFDFGLFDLFGLACSFTLLPLRPDRGNPGLGVTPGRPYPEIRKLSPRLARGRRIHL
jgi:hypothetical protein